MQLGGAMLEGTTLAGPGGPMPTVAAVLRVLIRQVIAPAIRRQTGAEPQEGSTE